MTPGKHPAFRYLFTAALCIGVAGAVFALASLLWKTRTTRLHRTRFRLEAPRTDGPPPVRQAGRLISRRAEALTDTLRVRGVTVTALPPDIVELEVRTSHDPTAALAWLTMPARVEFRLLHPREGVLEEGAEPDLPPDYQIKLYRARQYRLSPPRRLQTVEQRYAVQRRPALRIDAFRKVELEAVGLHKSCVLTFHFSEKDAREFARLTALHAGRRMAMLVDGEMFFPPKEIEGAVTDGIVQVEGLFHLPPLRKLTRILNLGPLPGRLVEVSGSDR